MVCVQYNKPKTSVTNNEIAELIVEINEKLGSEMLFVEEYQRHVKNGLFKKKIAKLYYIYWDTEYGEYQVMMGGQSFNEQAALAYLLGYIGGYERHERLNKKV